MHHKDISLSLRNHTGVTVAALGIWRINHLNPFAILFMFLLRLGHVLFMTTVFLWDVNTYPLSYGWVLLKYRFMRKLFYICTLNTFQLISDSGKGPYFQPWRIAWSVWMFSCPWYGCCQYIAINWDTKILYWYLKYYRKMKTPFNKI